MPKVVLELFKGTGSVGKVAKKMGWEVVSIDNEEKFKPDILTDILKWDYKKANIKPDVIWASPPCTSFSILNQSLKKPHRDRKTMKPLTEIGRLGNRILNRTLKIISYFQKKNPKLNFVIENPRGYMRRMPSLQKFYRTTTSYDQYGFDYKKPTDFFSNVDLKLKEVKKEPAKGQCEGQRRDTLYRIPPRLVKAILKQI